jgi:hypothetical protein
MSPFDSRHTNGHLTVQISKSEIETSRTRYSLTSPALDQADQDANAQHISALASRRMRGETGHCSLADRPHVAVSVAPRISPQLQAHAVKSLLHENLV